MLPRERTPFGTPAGRSPPDTSGVRHPTPIDRQADGIYLALLVATHRSLTSDAPFAREYSAPPVKKRGRPSVPRLPCGSLWLVRAFGQILWIVPSHSGRGNGRAGHATTPHSRAASQLFTCQRVDHPSRHDHHRVFSRIAPVSPRLNESRRKMNFSVGPFCNRVVDHRKSTV